VKKLVLLGILVGLLAGRAAEAAPPPGWEEPPPLPASVAAKQGAGKKKSAAACCKFDEVCCSRQSNIEDFVPSRVARVFEVKLADLPEALVKEAAKDGPPIPGAPGVRVIDGTGRPFPWPDGPKGWDYRVMPPGRYGEVKFRSEWFEGFFEAEEYRGMGAGAVHTFEKKDRGPELVTGPIEFLSIAKGEGRTITIDEVKGKLEGSPEVKATYWLHAVANDLAEGVIHGYRAPFEGEVRAAFMMPEVRLGFESKDAKSLGGHFRSRFANTVPFTLYWLPLGAGKSGLVNCELDEYQVRRWFPRPEGAKKLPGSFHVAIASSQTSVEPEARIRIFFYEPRG